MLLLVLQRPPSLGTEPHGTATSAAAAELVRVAEASSWLMSSPRLARGAVVERSPDCTCTAASAGPQRETMMEFFFAVTLIRFQKRRVKKNKQT